MTINGQINYNNSQFLLNNFVKNHNYQIRKQNGLF